MSVQTAANSNEKQIRVSGDNALLILTSQALLKSNSMNRSVAFISIILNIVLVVVVVMLVKTAKEIEVKAYGLTPDLRAVPLNEIKDDLYSPAKVMEWAGSKAKDMHTFTFRTIADGEHQTKLTQYMNEGSRAAFIKSLQRDGIEKDVKEKNALVYAEYYKDKQPLYIRSFVSPQTGTTLHVVEVYLIVTIDSRRVGTNERNRQLLVPMELTIGEVGLGRAPDGLLIGSIKRVSASK